MTRLKDLTLSMIGFLILVVAVVAIIPRDVPSQSLQGSDGSYPAPPDPLAAYPLNAEGDTTVVEQPELTLPVQAPLPIVEGVYRASPTQILSLTGNVSIKRVLNYDIAGNTLVAKAELTGGGTALLRIDLASGSIENLLEVSEQPYTGFNELQVSNHYVVWLDPAPQNNEKLLKVFDMSQGTVSTLQSGLLGEMDLQDSIVVWSKSSDADILAYNLVTEELEEVAVDSRETRFPRICSSDWVAFLHDFAEQERFVFSTSADLSIRHLSTGQEIFIGHVSNVSTVPGDRITNFDCDSESLAWITSTSQGDSQQSELYVYNFDTDESSLLQDFHGEFEPYSNFVLLDGSIIISRVGYDLESQELFTPIIDRAKLFGPSYLSNNKLVWIEDHESEAGTIYLVSIHLF